MAQPQIKIQNTSDASNDSLKALLVGFPGTSKTYSAASLPGKTLILSFEAGLLGLRDKGIPYIDCTTHDSERDPHGEMRSLTSVEKVAKLGIVYQMLKAEKICDNIFIDSITEVAECLVNVVQAEFPDRKDSLPMWGEYAKRMRAIVKSFRDLKGYNVFMTCLAKVDVDENKRRFLACDVVGKIGTQLPQFFDEVLYCFRNPEGEYRYYTKKTETGIAKDRSGKLDEDMPADLGLLMLKILGKKEKEKKVNV